MGGPVKVSYIRISEKVPHPARMAESVDAGDSKSPDGNIVRVRVSFWAFPYENQRKMAPDLEAVFDARKQAGKNRGV